MWIPRNQFAEVLRLLRALSFDSGGILILSASDVDSVCATRILATLLQRELISYTIKPVRVLEDIQKEGTTLSNTTRVVFLINCGAKIEIRNELGLDEEDNIYVFICDSHLPVNLVNIDQNEKKVRRPEIILNLGLVGARFSRRNKTG
jgi:cell division control protein 45